MCILSGCDFLAGLQGIGVRKAHGYVRKYKGFTRVRRPPGHTVSAPALISRRRTLYQASPCSLLSARPRRMCRARSLCSFLRCFQATPLCPGCLPHAGPAVHLPRARSCSRCCASAACRCRRATRLASSGRCGRSATAGEARRRVWCEGGRRRGAWRATRTRVRAGAGLATFRKVTLHAAPITTPAHPPPQGVLPRGAHHGAPHAAARRRRRRRRC